MAISARRLPLSFDEHKQVQSMKHVWMDVDPGHDDAVAIMLAANLPEINLLGLSTTHGNASVNWTTINAAKCLHAFGAPRHIRVYRGASEPLLLPAKHDPEIHGEDGLGGVEGLAACDDPRVLAHLAKNDDGSAANALEGMSHHIKEVWNNGLGRQVSVISTGPMTNIALFVSVYRELLPAIEEFVFMGGGVGLGNRSAVAEYNILCDPHAAQIVLNVPTKKTMIPINVTHTAIITREKHTQLLHPGSVFSEDLPRPLTNLRHTLSTMISFFADSYRMTFGFKDGPPLHDALTIAYVARPELFTTTRHRVDIELTGTHSMGETVVDLWKYKPADDSWGSTGRNCLVADSLKVHEFFELLLDTIYMCDDRTPLNPSR